MEPIRATTVIAVKKNGQVAMAGDGQVTQGQMVMKHSAKKIRRLYDGSILSGFAGATADAFSLFSKFEAKLDAYKGQLTRSVVELAKEWRSDKILRNLEAMLVVANVDHLFLVGGNGDLIEPDDGIVAIGSGGYFAYAAAKALVRNTDKNAREIVEESMKIAADICVYTNDQITVEAIES